MPSHQCVTCYIKSILGVFLVFFLYVCVNDYYFSIYLLGLLLLLFFLIVYYFRFVRFSVSLFTRSKKKRKKEFVISSALIFFMLFSSTLLHYLFICVFPSNELYLDIPIHHFESIDRRWRQRWSAMIAKTIYQKKIQIESHHVMDMIHKSDEKKEEINNWEITSYFGGMK